MTGEKSREGSRQVRGSGRGGVQVGGPSRENVQAGERSKQRRSTDGLGSRQARF